MDIIEERQNAFDQQALVFECSICHRLLKDKKAVMNHKRNHVEKKRYQCEFCKKSFSTKQTLVIHVRSHTGEKPYLCTYCNKGFTASCRLQVHTRIHTDERPYKCICNKAFRTRTQLLVHKKSHSDEKSYACQYCYKKFKSIAGFHLHKRIHIEKNCNDCGEAYITNTNYVHECKYPELASTWFCTICFLFFSTLESFRRHEQSHYSRHQCDVCLRCFKNSRNLEQHKSIHSDIRPSTCSFCFKTFRCVSNLNSHLKRIHSGHTVNNRCDMCFQTSSDLVIHKRCVANQTISLCEKCCETFNVEENVLLDIQLV